MKTPPDKPAFKDSLYAEFARVGKALASARRLELLELLAQGEQTVEDLAAETAMSVANTSLRAARLVDVRRQRAARGLSSGGPVCLPPLAGPAQAGRGAPRRNSPPRTLREIARVLRPGGRLQLGDIVVEQELSEQIRSDIGLWTG